MESRQQMQERRQRIVEEMLAMRSMKRGTLNEQFFPVPQKGRKEPALRGPYYVFSRKELGRTISKRVPAKEVERVREDIACYNRFLELSREFVQITQWLGETERSHAVQEQELKKKPKLPSKKTRK
ncbi:MAG: hypothetical protein IMZ62_16540 [Chloroflexi bacterium]|nr:hypothetical protein [Chloroflexota bacterium]